MSTQLRCFVQNKAGSMAGSETLCRLDGTSQDVRRSPVKKKPAEAGLVKFGAMLLRRLPQAAPPISAAVRLLVARLRLI
jgi:hypothetical protein